MHIVRLVDQVMLVSFSPCKTGRKRRRTDAYALAIKRIGHDRLSVYNCARDRDETANIAISLHTESIGGWA
jgi:hypothetical protein